MLFALTSILSACAIADRTLVQERKKCATTTFTLTLGRNDEAFSLDVCEKVALSRKRECQGYFEFNPDKPEDGCKCCDQNTKFEESEGENVYRYDLELGECVAEIELKKETCEAIKEQVACVSEGRSLLSDGICDWIPLVEKRDKSDKKTEVADCTAITDQVECRKASNCKFYEGESPACQLFTGVRSGDKEERVPRGPKEERKVPEEPKGEYECSDFTTAQSCRPLSKCYWDKKKLKCFLDARLEKVTVPCSERQTRRVCTDKCEWDKTSCKEKLVECGGLAQWACNALSECKFEEEKCKPAPLLAGCIDTDGTETCKSANAKNLCESEILGATFRMTCRRTCDFCAMDYAKTEGIEIEGTPFKVHNDLTLVRCIDKCQAKDTCKSIDYSAIGGRCNLHSASIACGGALKVNGGFDHFEKQNITC